MLLKKNKFIFFNFLFNILNIRSLTVLKTSKNISDFNIQSNSGVVLLKSSVNELQINGEDGMTVCGR